MVSTQSIGILGEKFVKESLKYSGFTIIKHKIHFYDSIGIEAVSSEHILIKVKTAVPPSEPSHLTKDEFVGVKKLASKLKAHPYLARVKLNSHFQLHGLIEWVKLN